MVGDGSVVVVGGTRAIGLEIARHYASTGRKVVLTGRDAAHVGAATRELSGDVRGVTFDLARPKEIAPALAEVGRVDYLVLAALVGFTEVVHALAPRLHDESAIVLFGGMAKERPYVGSTTVSTVNGGVTGLTRTLVEELRPIRVNAIHPGVVGDSPYWAGKPAAIANYTAQTPLGHLARMADIVHAVVFLLENGAVNGVDLMVDGGWHCR
jgi:NAD(P)-dependent dehydrogenase (short-subunit alcohol dehydrogenase family)